MSLKWSILLWFNLSWIDSITYSIIIHVLSKLTLALQSSHAAIVTLLRLYSKGHICLDSSSTRLIRNGDIFPSLKLHVWDQNKFPNRDDNGCKSVRPVSKIGRSKPVFYLIDVVSVRASTWKLRSLRSHVLPHGRQLHGGHSARLGRWLEQSDGRRLEDTFQVRLH